MRWIPVAVVSALLLWAGPASAQWDPSASADLGAGYGDLALSQSILSNTRGGDGGGASKPTHRKQPKAPTARQLRALRYVPDPAVTAADNARVAQVLLASCPPDRVGCPANHAEIIDKYLPTGVLFDTFGKNVKELLGGSRRNLADVAAGFVVLIWATRHERADSDAVLTDAQTRGAKRFLRDTRRALARNRKIRRLPDAEQQRVAETLATVAQHGINLHRTYLVLGETAAADELRDYLRDVAEDWIGVDVGELRLTRRGFVRR